MNLFAASSTSSSNKTKKEIPSSSSSISKSISKSKSKSKTDDSILSFDELGLCEWIQDATKAMGFKKPTDIQRSCIPGILQGQNVMGCAQTGSGKTAAFVLPILQKLSEDPYGIYCLVLIPTRELAIQMNEQISALGAPIGIRIALIIGGMSIIDQGIALSKQPHFVCATPGRLRHHLESADPPNLKNAKFLVLDEADRLISAGFASELEIILENMSSERQTLIFSATLTQSLEELEKYSSKKTIRYDLSSSKANLIPQKLLQQYLLMPTQVKMSYLVGVLSQIINTTNNDDDSDTDNNKKFNKKNKKRSIKEINLSNKLQISIIIFVGTCKRCQEIQETLLQLGFDCVALHSIMNQSRRIASLGKFKNQYCKILLATDIASRGLDIPSVELVVNFDLPKVAADYVHRIGRTARAGRSGRSLSFITPNEIDLVHNIETYTKIKMTKSDEIDDATIIPYLNPVAKAMRDAVQKLTEVGFDEQVESFANKKRAEKKKRMKNK